MLIPFLCRRCSTPIIFYCQLLVALAALRQKQAYEGELNRIAGTRLTLEAQVNAIETANLNAETMVAMKKGADALKGIHGSLYVYVCSYRVTSPCGLAIAKHATKQRRILTARAARLTVRLLPFYLVIS
jgi:hypothetical protein